MYMLRCSACDTPLPQLEVYGHHTVIIYIYLYKSYLVI